jgi:hypothetical protein
VEATESTMSLSDENVQVLNLVQAMIGAVSPNLRRVALAAPAPGMVRLAFVLERDESADREEIADIAFKFEALQAQGIDLEVDIVADARPIWEITLPGRVVFGRKE